MTISVDIDAGDTGARRALLEDILGTATVVVASGGEWPDPATDVVHDKLHLHWRLAVPTRTAEDHARLGDARRWAAQLVGADGTAGPIVHPLRWPGTLHLKGAPRMARIVAEADAEVSLQGALDALQAAGGERGVVLASRAHVRPVTRLISVDADQPRNIDRFVEHCRRADPAVPGVWHDALRDLACEAVRCAVSVEKAQGVVLGEFVPRSTGFYDDGRHERWEADFAGSYQWALGFREHGLHSVDAEYATFAGLTVVPPPQEPPPRAPAPTPTTRTEADRRTNGGDYIAPQRFSDDALAMTFADRHADELRYVPAWGHWLRFDGARWAKDDRLTVFDLARVVCREGAADAAGDRGGENIARTLNSATTVSAVERMARSDRRHVRSADDFDADPWALNTPGGVLDLQTGEIRPHTSSELHTKVAGATPGGACPRWLAFIDQITQGDAGLAAYLQRFAGYTLTGSISEQAFLFAYGPGGNGKGVLFGALAAVLGDYATTAAPEVFTVSRQDQHPTAVAALRGARMVAVTETEEGRQWAEARVKAVTGGDKISARVMRGDPFEFTPVCKLWFSGNHKPPLRNPDAAMRRRMNLVPLTYVPSAPDTGLADALRAELPGILSWAVQGCLEWQRTGLAPPAIVRDATDGYFAAQDSLGQWLEERCDRVAGAVVPSRAAFLDWHNWARLRGEEPGTEKRFSEALERKFAKRKTKTHQVFDGLRLRPAGGFEGVVPDDAPALMAQ